jgi:tyrosyl-tRNA synthetase
MLYEIFKKLNTVRSRKRPFAKWAKTEKSENIECIKQVYNVSDSKAKEILRLLSKEDIQQIKQQIETGGLRK